MLTKEQNELLTRTGPDTPMGQMFRRYWLPALLAEELPENEGPPIRVKLLSERLLAWRDSQGRYSLIDEFCAHRGTSLWVGRNEENGLRCPYHGWKYDWTGQCIEVPSEPEESGFCKKIKLRSYPLIERGGIVWTYMGPPEHQPPLPDYEYALLPAGQRYYSKRLQECNWLQALDGGGADSSHVSFLHHNDIHSDPLFKGTKSNEYNVRDLKPVFEVVESDGGLFVGSRRNAENNNYYWRISQWIMPAFTLIPPRGDYSASGHVWVPIDDEHCWTWSINYHPTRKLSEAELDAMRGGKGIHVKYVLGTFRMIANKDNDYLIDRAAQKAGISYSGIEGIAIQDAAVQELMGPVVDRTKENLVSTDNGIIMTRHRLLRAVKALSEKGISPPGIDPAHHRVRPAAFILRRDQTFKDAAREALIARPGAALTSV
jgi:phenylpropionate dioxygenase-like ring-hydroxylating dioxygenase large terminal subunit